MDITLRLLVRINRFGKVPANAVECTVVQHL